MSEILKPTLPEPNWARIISSAPEMLTSFLLTVSGAFLGAAIGTEGFWGNPWSWCAFALFLVGGLLSWARRGRKKNLETTHARQRENELSKLDNSYRLTIQEMAQNAFMVAAALRSLNKPDLEKSLPETRKLILQIIQHRLGPPSGTRVCLFVVDPEASAAGEPDRIIASGLGENGRATTPSIRVFTEDDETSSCQ